MRKKQTKKCVVLKLNSGYDIIGMVSNIETNSASSFCIENPLSMLSSIYENGSTIIFLRHFTPLSNDTTININYSHIITTYQPEQILIDYYETMIKYNEKYIKKDILHGMKAATDALKNLNETDGDRKSSNKEQKIEDMIDYYSELLSHKNKKTH